MSFQQIPEQNHNCSVCGDLLLEGEIVFELNCGHKIHESCMNYAVDSRCPTCQHDISESITTSIYKDPKKRLTADHVNDLVFCTVCKSNVFEGQKVVELVCGHKFHEECSKYMGPKCKICSASKDAHRVYVVGSSIRNSLTIEDNHNSEAMQFSVYKRNTCEYHAVTESEYGRSFHSERQKSTGSNPCTICHPEERTKHSFEYGGTTSGISEEQQLPLMLCPSCNVHISNGQRVAELQCGHVLHERCCEFISNDRCPECACNKEIRNTYNFTYAGKGASLQTESVGLRCAICNQPAHVGQKIVELLCGHEFHEECSKYLSNNKCPLCRAVRISKLTYIYGASRRRSLSVRGVSSVSRAILKDEQAQKSHEESSSPHSHQTELDFDLLEDDDDHVKADDVNTSETNDYGRANEFTRPGEYDGVAQPIKPSDQNNSFELGAPILKHFCPGVTSCYICEGTMYEGQEVTKLRCGHLFHKRCSAYICTGKCPICQLDIEGPASSEPYPHMAEETEIGGIGVDTSICGMCGESILDGQRAAELKCGHRLHVKCCRYITPSTGCPACRSMTDTPRPCVEGWSSSVPSVECQCGIGSTTLCEVCMDRMFPNDGVTEHTYDHRFHDEHTKYSTYGCHPSYQQTKNVSNVSSLPFFDRGYPVTSSLDYQASGGLSKDPGPVCSVCGDKIYDGQNSLELRCGHLFHDGCIVDLNGNCPDCGKDIITSRSFAYSKQFGKPYTPPTSWESGATFCPICEGNIYKGQYVVKLTCGHGFHEECSKYSPDGRCPICHARKDIRFTCNARISAGKSDSSNIQRGSLSDIMNEAFCTICKRVVHEGEKVIEYKCGHSFHEECSKYSRSNLCSICRMEKNINRVYGWGSSKRRTASIEL